MLRYIVIGMILALVAGYLWAMTPVSPSNADVIGGTTDDGKIVINPIPSVGANNSSYAVDFQLMSREGNISAGYEIDSFFCPNLTSDGKCYNSVSVVSNTVPISGSKFGDLWSPRISPEMVNPQFHNCGLYQIDIKLFNYPNEHNTHTYQASGGLNAGHSCSIPNPTATPVPPTMTPVPTIPNPTLTPVPTETTQNCGDNNTTNQTGTNNNDNNNCNNNQNNNNNNNSSNSNSDSNSSSSSSSDQNNNQSINNSNTNNITITSYAPAQQQQQQVEVAPAPAATSLPSTGPTDSLVFMGMPFLGYFIKRFTKLG